MLCADAPLEGCASVYGGFGYCCLSAIVASAQVSCLLSLSFPQTKKQKTNKKPLPTTLGKKHIYIFVMRDLDYLLSPRSNLFLIYRPICQRVSSTIGEYCSGEEATSWPTSSRRFRSVLYTLPLPFPLYEKFSHPSPLFVTYWYPKHLILGDK